jgi:hypothetical protein
MLTLVVFRLTETKEERIPAVPQDSFSCLRKRDSVLNSFYGFQKLSK